MQRRGCGGRWSVRERVFVCSVVCVCVCVDMSNPNPSSLTYISSLFLLTTN